jgi:ABC-2 type transport system permease protein
MIVVELVKMARRPRTWVSLGVLCGLPILVAIFLAITRLGPQPGEQPAFLAAVLNNGALFPAAALAIVLPLFLPVAVAVIGGDAIAGEASGGTLRYLLLRPVGRTKLLVAKLFSLIVFTVTGVVLVVATSLAIGLTLFPEQPGAVVTSVSGVALTPQQLTWRIVGAMLYVALSMLGVGAIAVFFSTLTDSPLAAALGALAALVTSQVLVALDAAGSVRPYLPTRYWLAWIDLFRDPIPWRDIDRGLAIQIVYVGVFLGAAWANFSSKDIKS